MTHAVKYEPTDAERIFSWPIDMTLARFTPGNGFGKRRRPGTPPGEFEDHRALDIGAPAGTPVYAAADGIVDVALADGAGGDTRSGNHVWIRHENWLTGYFHLQAAPLVNEGQTVKRGDLIGYVGSTGNGGGEHLCWHTQLTRGGQALAMNPRQVMRDYGRSDA
ncbi:MULTISPECIES: M23 family metallopeptidase [unclassified Pseudoclavibacter]|uniref:M23 family metallopeptidase n=1 Tax=unclassified Pseudoclavibacter TaxID=2615177 RepID=UPI001BAB4B9D|nr:M23 family metallopeptidase [Pseudoclavibacter sp. Marseille-Q4354]MBS3177760.1 M23 family metallopeptidase [Pseudoclavibacter sp. Marseille-Q4354]